MNANSDNLIADGLNQLLDSLCPPTAVRTIEADPRRAGPAGDLWRSIEQAGFADVMLSEAQGGAGLGLSEMFTLIEMCGAKAVPVPLAETFLARAALSQAGIAIPSGSIALGVAQQHAEAWVCPDLSLGRVADWAMLETPGGWVLIACASAQLGESPGGLPLNARMEWPTAAWSTAQSFGAPMAMRTLQAMIYAAQLAGACMTVFSRTLNYANERQQFGRPIGKFQAIQHQLSVISEHAFAARMAAQIACQAAAGSNQCWPDPLKVAVGKARTSEAALEVAALSHSIHGAIGFTREFDLQLFTRRLHVWRQTAGAESWWQAYLGRALLDQPNSMALEFLREITDAA